MRLGAKHLAIGTVGVQQGVASGILHKIGQVLVMGCQRENSLGRRCSVPVDDLDHRQGQDALGGFLQSTVKDFVKLVSNHQSGDSYRDQPE